MKLLVALIFTLSFTTFAHHHHSTKPRREYYDYDTEGTRGDRVARGIGHASLKVATSPFRALRAGYRGTKYVVRSVKNNTEIFLTDAGSIGDRQKLRDVLQGWENSEDLKTVLDREKRHGQRFMFGLPHDAWRLLKNTLYTAGYRIPRATLRVVKSIIIGSRHIIGV